MRNIEECTAEVFRRSEEKIQKRKQNQKRIAVIVLPLCAVVLCVIALPFLLDGSNSTLEAAPEAADGTYSTPESFYLGGSSGSANSYGFSDNVEAGLEAPEAGVEVTGSINGRTIVVSEADSLILQEFLQDLPYCLHRVCKCLPQYTLKTTFGSFDVHLGEGYARCEGGQAALTKEQIEIIRKIIADS